jgi:AraC-like DNA-binding protein
MPSEQTGWLAGLSDRFVGRALTLLHSRPGHSWSVEELARQVGLSRSAFAERFINFAGQPPIQYLTAWRMQFAVRMLFDGADDVATLATNPKPLSTEPSKSLLGCLRQLGAGNGQGQLEISQSCRYLGAGCHHIAPTARRTRSGSTIAWGERFLGALLAAGSSTATAEAMRSKRMALQVALPP